MFKSFGIELFLLVVLFCLRRRGCNATTGCNYFKSCEEDTISDDSVWCRGWLACYDATIDVSQSAICGGQRGCQNASITTDDGAVYCDGWMGCKKGQVEVTGDGKVECRGRRGCSYSNISASSASVSCEGEEGCLYANINSASSLTCDGFYACKYTVVSDTASITTNGDYGMRNALISSDGVDKLTIDSNGYYGLNGAQLDCYDGSNCTVNCGEGLTCKGFDFYCYDGAICILNCDDDCSNCPSITTVTSSTISKGKRKYQEYIQLDYAKEDDNDHDGSVNVDEFQFEFGRVNQINNFSHNIYVDAISTIIFLLALFAFVIVCIYKVMDICLMKGYQRIKDDMEYKPLASFNSA